MQETTLAVTILEAAQRLGCGRTTIYKLIRAGELPAIKVGRLARIPVVDLVDYVDRQRSQARTTAAA